MSVSVLLAVLVCAPCYELAIAESGCTAARNLTYWSTAFRLYVSPWCESRQGQTPVGGSKGDARQRAHRCRNFGRFTLVTKAWRK